MEPPKEIETDTCSSHVENKVDSQHQIINQEQPVLSKRQLKFLAKRKRWLESKPLRRAKEKEKKKLKIQKAKEAGIFLRPSRKMLKASKMSDSSCKLRVCFDLSLSNLMTSAELSKTFKQLHRCYSINRRASAPLQLYITGYDEETKSAMNKLSGCFNWDVNFHEQIYYQVFDKSDIIYLTSDSPNVLESFDHSKAYIIGALVDHNRLKNVCYDKAVKEGVGHARLPLDTYFKFKTRTVLTIDQVYSIILQITEEKTWIDAVSNTVPKRKGIEVKNDFNGNDMELGETPISNSNKKENNAECAKSIVSDFDITQVGDKNCDSHLRDDSSIVVNFSEDNMTTQNE